MEGILNIDKPLGLTSHDVVASVRRLSGVRRTGHSGTLDPLATGVLVLALGRATRLLEYVVGRPKIYRATILLGQTTTTYDAEGEIVEERPVPPEITAAHIDQALEQFRGKISQVPPMYSALKKDGQPLYKLARQGIEVERKARQVTIYKLRLLEWDAPQLDLEITCSAGTYIRSIAHDLGEALGCGGYLAKLRRTAVGQFTADDAIALDSLSPDNIATHLLPSDAAVAHLPRVELSHENSLALQNGKQVPVQQAPAGELVRVYNPAGSFVGLVTAHKQSWRAKKMFLTLNSG